jgi:hypothetical protein
MSAMERRPYRTTYRRSPGSNTRAFNEPRRDAQHVPYTSGPSTDFSSDYSIPLFVSDPQGQPDPREFAPLAPSHLLPIHLAPSRRKSILARVMAGGLVVSAFAILVAVGVFNSNVTRVLIDKARAPMGGATEDQSALQAASTQPVGETPLKEPALVPEPATQTSVDASSPQPETPSSPRPETPTREAILSANDTTPQSQAPVAPAKTLDAETLAALMSRARSLLALGDIAAARLLLERAANEQNATAAFLLAQTFDPEVLGVRDVRSTAPDPVMARDWYRAAASLGSADAQQRLSQLQN